MKKIILGIILNISTICFSQISMNDLLSNNNVSNILKQGYVRKNNNEFIKYNNDKISFFEYENVWFGNDKRTFDKLKSFIDSSFYLKNNKNYGDYQSTHYVKNNISYIFTVYNSSIPYRYVVTCFFYNKVNYND